MKPEQRKIVVDALAEYGSGLDEENHILGQDGKKLSTRVEVKQNRLRVLSKAGLVASLPVTAVAVGHFVERFWFWKKKPPTPASLAP